MNRIQQRMFYAAARWVYLLAARRFGKTDGGIGPRLWAVAQSMPQGAGVFLGASRKQLFSRTVPAALAALRRFYHLEEGVHFGFGKPPRSVPDCLVKPKDFSNILWFANGFIYHCASLAVLGSVNGNTFNSIIADECKFLPKKKIDEEVIPTNSGIPDPLNRPGHSEANPYYKSLFFCSDASLNSKGNWLAKMEDRQEEVIDFGPCEGKTYAQVQDELTHYADRVIYFNELLRSAKKNGHRVQIVSKEQKVVIRALARKVLAREDKFRIIPPQYKTISKGTIDYLTNYHLIDPDDAELLYDWEYLITEKEKIEMFAIKNSKKYQQHINDLRCNCRYFVRASSLDNIDILGEDYIRQMRLLLPPVTYAISVLNVKMKKSGEGFYSAFDPDIHCYLDDGNMTPVEDSTKVKLGKQIVGGTAYKTEYETPDFDYLSELRDCTLDGDLDPNLPLEIALDYNNLINWVVIGQLKKIGGRETLCIINSMFVKNGQMIQDLIRDFDRYYAPHRARNRQVNYYFSHTAKFRLHGIAMLDIKDTVRQELERYGWQVRMVDEGQAPKHEQKYQVINSALSGLEYPQIRLNKSNNESLIGAIEMADVEIGYHGFRKSKQGEKLSVDAEDAVPEELRTDGTDAFDELYWGVRYFRFQSSFLMTPSGR